jgi:hypothetical protein
MRSSRLARNALALAATLAPSLALACAWEFAPEEGAFFNQLAFVRPSEHPFVYASLARLHARSAGPTDLNLDEWMRFFDGKVDREAWAQLLSRDDLKRLDALINQLKGKEDAKASAADRTFFAFPDRDRLVAALMYVGFAKRVEPIALAARRPDDWSDPVVVDRRAQFPTIDKLSTAGAKQAQAERDPFLRQRYAFQLLRLQFYRGDHAKVVALFAQWRSELSRPGVIAARALSTLAGAVRKQGDVARANLLYASAFDATHDDDAREVAFTSARFDDEKTLAATLALATTPRERAITWALVGARGSELRALKELSRAEPGSDLIPLVLVRAVVKAELATARNAGEVTPLLDWLRAEVGKQQPAPFVLQLSLAHLEAVMHDARALPDALEAAKRAPADGLGAEQAHVTTLFAALSAPGPLDEALVLREAAPIFAGKYGARISSWAGRELSSRWATKDPVLAAAFAGATNTGDTDLLQKLKAFLAKPNKAPLEQLAASAWHDDSLDRRLGAAFVARGDLARAAPFFAAEKDALRVDPFTLNARDCIECDEARPGHRTYTRAQAVARMAELQRSGKPADLVELGAAVYNASEWGNACLGFHEYNQDLFRLTAELARRALETKDRETRARAALLLAKAELQQHYASPTYQPGNDFVVGDGFRALATLEDTRFAREALKECGYYKAYRHR